MPQPPTAIENRNYAAAHFALELDGKDNVGLFRSIEGGGVKAEVMTYQNGANYERWRQLGKPKFEDIKLQVGMAMSEPFYTWISNFFTGDAARKSGAIVAADFYYKERARREFTAAMIKELTFPKLEGHDGTAVYMTVGLSVEGIVFKKGDGHALPQPDGFNKQKLWTARNFRFHVDGFEPACHRITKIDSFTIKQNVLEYHMGGAKAPTKTPSQIDWPTIAFYVPEADAHPFFKHVTKRMIKDGNMPGRLHGMLQTYDNGKKDLFTLEFFNGDIISVTPDKSDAGTDEHKMVKVEMYTERMSFKYAPPTPPKTV
jgi:phage tail-like protein